MINFMTRFGKLVTARTVVTMTAMTRKTKNEKEALAQAMTARTRNLKVLVRSRGLVRWRA